MVNSAPTISSSKTPQNIGASSQALRLNRSLSQPRETKWQSKRLRWFHRLLSPFSTINKLTSFPRAVQGGPLGVAVQVEANAVCFHFEILGPQVAQASLKNYLQRH